MEISNNKFINLLYIIIDSFMRSLYVDDIPGAKPTKKFYDKSLYRIRNQQQIVRHSKKNPEQKRVIQWYLPTKRATQPLDRNDDEYWRTKRTLKKSFDMNAQDLSKSMQMRQPRSRSSLNMQNQMVNTNSLSGAGRNLLNNSSILSQDPYFPHRYVDKSVGQTNKWSGSKIWHDQPTKIINLPSIKDYYYKRW